MAESSQHGGTARIAGMVTVALSLTTAGYQYNKAELLEMQASLKRQMHERNIHKLKTEEDGLGEKVKALKLQLELSQQRLEQQRKVDLVEELKSNCTGPQQGVTTGIFEATAACKKPTMVAIAEGLPAVYIQVTGKDEETVAYARVVRARLREKGYAVPQLELVLPARMPRHNELRHVYREDGAAAQKLKEVLEALDVGKVADLRLKPAMENYAGKAPRNVMELWLASKR